MSLLTKHIAALLLLSVFAVHTHATHIRAGEITYKHLSGDDYLVTVITYTDPNPPTNPAPPTDKITIDWGNNGATTDVQRKEMIPLTGHIQKNVYEVKHTFNSTSEALYVISVTDFARVGGIVNINGGDTKDIPFYIQSTLRVSQNYGINQSPILSIPPIVDGCTGYLYLHNPGAHDPDGDSLAYTIIPPRQSAKENVPNYNTPTHLDSFGINPLTGTLYWANPMGKGVYNIAILITEYRYGKIVGTIMRDMQIFIEDCKNKIPKITTPADQCVNAGDTARATVTATDSGNQVIALTGYGGPFEVLTDKAYLTPNPAQGIDNITATLIWKTNCSHIRYRPYQAEIEAKDNDKPAAANYSVFNITVVGPAPQVVTTKQKGNGFIISWTKDPCKRANKFKIYRRIDSSHWTPAHCQTGIPASTGFKLIGTTSGKDNEADTFFYDNNNGAGLSPIVNYCYRIVSVFPPRIASGGTVFSDPAESYASIEVCDAIIRSKPVITHVSVTTTDVVNGALKLAWLRPDTLDTTVYTAPYRLVLKRAPIVAGVAGPFSTFKTIDYPTFASLNDSSIIDSNINTADSQFKYKIEMLYDSLGHAVFVDESPQASSIFTKIYSTDNTNMLTWNETVPWSNTNYTIYRRIPPALTFDSLASVTSPVYNDEGLVNNKQYCYYVMSSGGYSFYPPILLNNSQQICGTPIDTVKPCPPLLAVSPPCGIVNDFSNKLSWAPRDGCGDDVVSYKIYYKKKVSDAFTLLATTNNSTFAYTDDREELKTSVAGCYAVTAIDSFGNESFIANTTCTENCPYYEIPNVFSPNGDGKNDLLNPFPYKFIDHIQLSIYNRWGQLVFQTTDPDINWDGKDHFTSKKECSEGVYYYTCDVYEQYLEGLKNNARRGTIKLVR